VLHKRKPAPVVYVMRPQAYNNMLTDISRNQPEYLWEYDAPSLGSPAYSSDESYAKLYTARSKPPMRAGAAGRTRLEPTELDIKNRRIDEQENAAIRYEGVIDDRIKYEELMQNMLTEKERLQREQSALLKSVNNLEQDNVALQDKNYWLERDMQQLQRRLNILKRLMNSPPRGK